MFQRMCAVAMFVAALFISVIPNALANQQVENCGLLMRH